jgi:hypothetical protein
VGFFFFLSPEVCVVFIFFDKECGFYLIFLIKWMNALFLLNIQQRLHEEKITNSVVGNEMFIE